MTNTNETIQLAQERDLLRALLSLVAQGDQDALAQLYDRTSQMVYGLALRILRDPSTAEDITMEVYLQIWRTAQSYDSRRGTILPWLVTLVRSRAIDHLRTRKARGDQMQETIDRFIDLRDPSRSPELALVSARQSELIQKAVAALSPEQRRPIELAFFSGLSHSEVAARTGLPLGTVKTRIRQGMIRLRELLRPYPEVSREATATLSQTT